MRGLGDWLREQGYKETRKQERPPKRDLSAPRVAGRPTSSKSADLHYAYDGHSALRGVSLAVTRASSSR